MENFFVERRAGEVYIPSVNQAIRRWMCGGAFLKYFLFMIILGSAFSCFNPFFPPTDVPPANSALTSNSLRSTPKGVVQQLINAYQKRDFELYQDLFSGKKDFLFFISPGFIPQNVIPKNGKVDSMCSYIIGRGLSYLDYWTYFDEMKSHTRLFDQAEQVTLTFSGIDEIRYIVKGNRDTTNVEIIVRDGALEIIGKVYYDKDGNRSQDIYSVPSLGEQVFYLERDSQNPGLWVIQKWFDLNTMS
jgi:hypothetical protein